jgi:hypothetical protein
MHQWSDAESDYDYGWVGIGSVKQSLEGAKRKYTSSEKQNTCTERPSCTINSQQPHVLKSLIKIWRQNYIVFAKVDIIHNKTIKTIRT